MRTNEDGTDASAAAAQPPAAAAAARATAAPSPAGRPRRKRSRSAVAVLCAWAALLAAAAAGVGYRWYTQFERLAMRTLDVSIRHLDLQPDPSAAPVRFTNPADLAAISRWVAGARRGVPDGATARPATCDLVVTFGDGRTERMRVGPTAPPADGAVPNPAAAFAEIQWRGYTRYAPVGPVQPLMAGRSPLMPTTRAAPRP